MRLKNALLLFILGISFPIYAQVIDTVIVLPRQTFTSDAALASSSAFDNDGNFFSFNRVIGNVSFQINGEIETLNASEAREYFIKKDSDQNTLWAKPFLLGSGSAATNFTRCDLDGNIYAVGYVNGSADMDPSENEEMLVFESEVGFVYSTFIAKFTNDGELIWYIHLEEVNTADIEVLDDGGIILTGSYFGSPEFNPQGSSSTLPEMDDGYGEFVARYDSNGLLSWAHDLDNISLRELDVKSDGSIAISGKILGAADVDPSEFEVIINGFPNTLFVMEWSAAGDYEWVKPFADGGNSIWVDQMEIDDLDGIWITGRFGSSTDFHTEIGQEFIIEPFENTFYDVFILKLNSSGEFEWAGSFPSQYGEDYRQALNFDSENNALISFSYRGEMDLDPSEGEFLIQGIDNLNADCILIELDQEGNYLGSLNFYSSSLDSPLNLHNYNDQIFLEANYGLGPNSIPNTLDLEYPPGYNSYLFKISEQSCGLFSLSIDDFQEGSCLETGTVTMNPQYGEAPFTYQWLPTELGTMNTAIIENEGFYTLSASDANGCSTSRTVYVTGYNEFDTDPYVAYGYNALSPGYNTYFSVSAVNPSCLPTDGTLSFYINPIIEYVEVLPEPDLISNDTLYWNYTDLNADLDFFTLLEFYTPPGIIPGTIFPAYCEVIPEVDDSDPTNNATIAPIIVQGPYDPNDKSLSPIGECDQNYLPLDQILQYRIRFQNIGNAPATHVHIVDSLSDHLDLETLSIIDSSHPVVLELEQDSTLRFRFDNIQLPDSLSDPEGSQGFVIFSIEAKESTELWTVIENFADIYFDFNSPIRTNTVFHTITDGSHAFEVEMYGIDLGLFVEEIEGATYQWYKCEDNGTLTLVEGAIGSEFESFEGGYFSVSATVEGCTYFSDCEFVSGLSTSEEDFSHNLTLYPNPSSGEISLEMDDFSDNIFLSIYTLKGQMVYQKGMGSAIRNNVALDLPAGAYMALIQSEKGDNLARELLIIE